MIGLGQWLSIFLNTTHSNTIYSSIIEMGVLSKKKKKKITLRMWDILWYFVFSPPFFPSTKNSAGQESPNNLFHNPLMRNICSLENIAEMSSENYS